MAFKIENGVLKSVYGVNVTEIVIVPDNVKTVESLTFNNLTVKEFFFPDSVKKIQKKAFVDCTIQKISIPEYIDTTGIFANCSSPIEIERRKPTTKTTTVEEAFAEKKVVEEVHDTPAKSSETDYRQLFLALAYIKELPEKENILDDIYDDDVKIPLAVHFFIEYRSEKSKKYISDNFQKIMHNLVDKKDINGINAVMSIINKENPI